MIDSRIRFKAYNPKQDSLFPNRVEDWVPENDLSFFISNILNEFYKKGHLKPFYDKFQNRKTAGRAAYSPVMMLGIICYSYAKGIFSSREIEKKLRQDGPFRYLCDGNFPSYRTICRFRKNHLNDFKDLFVNVINHAANVCNLDFNEIGIDGTKIKANASKLKNRTNSEEDQNKPKKINRTDPDSRLMKTSQEGFQQSYNAQIAVDKKSQLILSCEVIQKFNDQGELIPMIDETINNVGKKPKVVLADAGYANEQDLKELERRNIEGYVATKKFKHKKNKEKNKKIKVENEATRRMSERLSTPEGRNEYRNRAWIVETPIAWIKRGRRFKQFCIRGLEHVKGEWNLVCLVQNLYRLHSYLKS